MNRLAVNRRERGEVNETDISDFASFAESELLSILHSEKTVERSCAAIHLRKYQNATVVDKLCNQLAVEKKLYTRIALCKTLVECRGLSIEPLIGLLGQIGKKHSKNEFLKYKITRCLSGFHDEWSKSFLLEIIKTGCKGLRLEALRSLLLLKIEIPDIIQNGFSSEMHKLESFLKKKLESKSGRCCKASGSQKC